MNLYTINTGFFKLDGGAMFGFVPKSIWNRLNPADEKNLCSWALRCLLIKDGNRLILIDNGNGDKQDEKFFSHYYLHGDDTLDKSLAAHGFSASDITDVFLTHLHFDHCGGSIKRENGKLVTSFPNAVYWSNEEHWKWATEPNDREKASFLKENILPIKESGQLEFLSLSADSAVTHSLSGKGDSGSVLPDWMSVLTVNGHTDAMMLPMIRYKDRTIVFMADLLPSAAHLPIPYIMAYDMFPMTSMVEKKAFLQEALDNNYILFFEHDPVHECCTLKMTDKGIRVDESFRLSEL